MSENIVCRKTHIELGITPGQNEIKAFNETQKILKISGILKSKIFCVNCRMEMPEATEKSTMEGKFIVTCQNCGSRNTMCTEIGVITGEENFGQLITRKPLR